MREDSPLATESCCRLADMKLNHAEKSFLQEAARPLPALDERYALREEACSQFAEAGHVFVPRLLIPSEVVAIRPAIERATMASNAEGRRLEDRDTYGKAFLQTFNLWVNDGAARALTFSARIARVAASLLGVRAVRLYHDQALFKEPGGGHTPWHQDQHYWPLATRRTITAWIPLITLDREMGILEFASGSHHRGSLMDLAISDDSEEALNALVKRHQFPIWSADSMQAGDATFHSGWTLHRAGPNVSSKMRSVMTIIYYDADARVAEPSNPDQQNDLSRWFTGLEPGDAAASPLNPILFDELESPA